MKAPFTLILLPLLLLGACARAPKAIVLREASQPVKAPSGGSSRTASSDPSETPMRMPTQPGDGDGLLAPNLGTMPTAQEMRPTVDTMAEVPPVIAKPPTEATTE